jgi:hypothetical protein
MRTISFLDFLFCRQVPIWLAGAFLFFGILGIEVNILTGIGWPILAFILAGLWCWIRHEKII